MNNIGILDPDGINLNPITNNTYSDVYKDLAKKWSKYPVYEQADTILNAIQNHNVLLIQAETGSGKSVLIPKFVWHYFNYKKKIIMCLPKQVITKSAAEFSAKTLDVELGKNISYKYKNSPSKYFNKEEENQILYCTDGTLVNMLLSDPLLLDYNAVILDELHERKINMDFILYLLKNVLNERKEFKLILMSATIDENIFKNYFNNGKLYQFMNINVGGGRTFPIESIFLETSSSYVNTLKNAQELIIKLVNEFNAKHKDIKIIDYNSDDIICFVVSSNDAFQLCKTINLNIEYPEKLFCVEVFSGMSSINQELAQDINLYKMDTKYNQKLIIATNVAESSLTINNIKFVVDTGYELKSYYDSVNNAKIMSRQYTTQAQIKQRMGRTGRTNPGICYHLYSENDYNNVFKKYPDTDIKITDLTYPSLNFLNLFKTTDKLISMYNQLIEPPPKINIDNAIFNLQYLNLIHDNEITQLGMLVNSLKFTQINSSLSFIYSKKFNCSNEMLIILCFIEVIKGNMNDVFVNIKQTNADKDDLNKLNKKINNIKDKFKSNKGDHITLLNIYEKYNSTKDKTKWAYKNFIKLNILNETKKLIKKMKGNYIHYDSLEMELNINDIYNLDVNNRIICALYFGFKNNIAIYNDKLFVYETIYTKKKNIQISNTSFVNNLPEYIIYNELFVSINNEYNLNIVSKINNKLKKILNID